jgi:hypothetical protein
MLLNMRRKLMMLLSQVNYLAVLLCGIVAIGFGALWYSPFLFGKMWMQETDEFDEDVKNRNNSIRVYGLTFLGHVTMAYVLARIMVYTNATTVTEGMRIAFLCWVGFTASTMMINAAYEKKSIRVVAVDGGYHLIILLIFGIIIGAWQ